MTLKHWDNISRYIPAVTALRNYSLKSAGADTIAGLTVAAVAVPQAMAYALVAGVPPQYGLYTAIVMTLVGALLASSRQLINGPTNAISIAVFSAVAVLPTLQERIEAAVLLALLVGLIQIGISLLRLGDLTRFVSHGVIVGFTVGAGLLIVLGQLKHLLGLAAQPPSQWHFLQRFWYTLTQSTVQGWTAAIGVGTILFLILVRWLKGKLDGRVAFLFPESLMAVVITLLLAWLLNLGDKGVALVSDIPPFLPAFAIPNLQFAQDSHYWSSALAIAVLGLLEAVAMSKALAARTKEKLDIHQQCLSEGVANLAGGFFQCIPGSGSLTRSAINRQAGAVSQWSGVIAALGVALTVLLLSSFAHYIPLAALAGILMVSAYRMVDRKQLIAYLRSSYFDAGIVLVTAYSAVFISVEFCIFIGVIMSFALYIPRAARLELIPLRVTPERVILEKKEADAPCERILIYRLDGELFFGSAPELEAHLDKINQQATGGIRIIVLSCRFARNPDAVCLSIFEDFIQQMRARRLTVIFCGVRPDLQHAFHSAGIDKLLGEKNIFLERTGAISSTLDAVRYAYDLLQGDYCEICPKRQGLAGEEGAWYYMI